MHLLTVCLSRVLADHDADHLSLAVPNRLMELNCGKTLFKPAPPGFQPRRKLKGLAKLFYRFVNSESGRISGDFKKNTSGLKKVDGMKILPVTHRSDGHILFNQQPAPVQLRCIVGTRKAT
jgi:hypothetical protein